MTATDSGYEIDGDELESALLATGLDVRPIRRLTGATPASFRRTIDEQRTPTLFSGLTDHWPARTAWNPETLNRTHGTTPVTALMDLPRGGVLFPKEQHSYERELTFGEFIDAMLTPSSPCYLAYTRAEQIFSTRDYGFAELLGESVMGTDTRVWIGSAGTRSMLHSDLKDNLFCQIWGEKYFVLLPWEQSKAAYPFPDNLVNSQIDLADLANLGSYPRLKSAVLYAGRVRTGDVLFVPRGCWHDVRSLTPSISINHWFGPPLTFPDYAKLLARLGPQYWAATARDFVRYGVLRRKEKTMFFFSPASTGKRLYDLVRRGDFSRDNDPSTG